MSERLQRGPVHHRARRRFARAHLFFFQEEDDIRDSSVTGVQTCALPILLRRKACWYSRQQARFRTPAAAGVRNRACCLEYQQALLRSSQVDAAANHLLRQTVVVACRGVAEERKMESVFS